MLGSLIANLNHGDLVHTTIGQVAEVRSGWGFPNAEQGMREGSRPFYKVSDMNLPGNELTMGTARNYIDDSAADRLGVKLAPAGTIIFPKIGAAVATNKKRVLSVSSAYDNNVMGLVPNDRVLSRFLLYFMRSIDLVTLSQDSGAVPSIRKSAVQALPILLPPIAVQTAIVEVLDRFSQLEDELEAELEARSRQLLHYQRVLTSAVEFGGRRKEEWAEFTLGDLCWLEKGRTALQKATPGRFPLVATSLARHSSEVFDFDGEAVCIPLISSKGHGVASISRLHYQRGKFALGTILCAAIPRDRQILSAEFLYHYLESRKDSLLVPLMRGGANVSLTIRSLHSVPVYIPQLEEQSKIVDKLRALSLLVTDESAGIPAEIAARRRQHGYYLQKLLSYPGSGSE